MKILVIHGTNRKDNKSINAANYITEVGNTVEGLEMQLISPADFPEVRNDKDVTEPNEYNELVKSVDGYVIVAPEYNHSFPGSLKTLLDGALREYVHRPVSIAGVSAGPWGGVRMIENLVPVVRELGMTITFADMMFPKVGTLFDENGKPTDDSMKERIVGALTELKWMAETMKWGRENLPSKYHEN